MGTRVYRIVPGTEKAKQYHILYPDDRWVTTETIQGWACDIKMDMGCESVYPQDIDIKEAINLLEDRGLITIAK